MANKSFEDLETAAFFSLGQTESRPPLYNAEDYVASLKKFGKLTGLQMYLGDADNAGAPVGPTSAFVQVNNRRNKSGKAKSMDDFEATEMGLRQFDTVTEMLSKLKDDLSLSFQSFSQEFISGDNDGVTLLLDLLKAIQLSQTNITGSLNQLGSRANHVMFKRALGDEFEVLLCLKICAKNEEGAAKLVEHPSGLFTVAVCVMSNYSKSRVLSLQLLSRLCDMTNGHRQVSDAISMLRLRFGEPVRFKFLVGMLNSYNSVIFQIACLRFLNRFLETSKDARERIQIQTELEDAGFDIDPLKRFLMQNSSKSKLLQEELERWSQNYIDVNNLVKKLLDAERANRKLREEVSKLKDKVKTFDSDRQKSLNTVDRLRQCCDHLQTEIDKRQSKSKATSTPTTSSSTKSAASQTSTTTRKVDEMPVYDFEDDDDDEDVLLLLPASEVQLQQVVKRGSDQAKLISGGVSISDDAGSLVTVLATDGYTCITSPVTSRQSQAVEAKTKEQSKSSSRSQRLMTGCSGDSGLSSDSSEPSPNSPAHNRSPHDEKEAFSDDSSGPEVSKNSSKQELEDDLEAMYAERNVLQEEALTVETEQISIDRFRQRFVGSSSNSDIGAVVDLDAPKSLAKLKISANDIDKEDVDEAEDDDESLIVPQRTPRPPPRHSAAGSRAAQSRKRAEMADLMEAKKREMLLHNSFSEDEGDSEDDLFVARVANNNDPNTNTMETMSAKSFGFVKPSTVQRQHDYANRLRRHKSFFTPNSNAMAYHDRRDDHRDPEAPPRGDRARQIRRSETFHHSRSVGDFDNLMSYDLRRRRELYQQRQQQHRGKSVERFLANEAVRVNKSLSKSKSMEFLKAKLLSRKSSRANRASPSPTPSGSSSSGPIGGPPGGVGRLIRDWDMRRSHSPPAWTRSSSREDQHSKEEYDWRQDTPFWNKKGRWARPASSKKAVEEPWFNLHQPKQPQAKPPTIQQQIPNGPTIQHHPINGGHGIPGWPGQQYPPGMLLNRPKVGGGFFPSFPMPYGGGMPSGVFLPRPFPDSGTRSQSSSGSGGGMPKPSPRGRGLMEEDLPSRLEITELSDEEEQPVIPVARGCPTPDYSTMQPPPRITSPGGHPMGPPDRNILDLPSGLY